MAIHEANITDDVVRPLANFPPSIWGDRFLSFSHDDSKLEAYAKAIEEPKEDIRRLLLSTAMDSNTKLRLINSVYRLGLKYIFLEEIEDQLDKLFKDFHLNDYDDVDLYTISISFQVFRQHGYKFSCDVFNKFKDCHSGKFKEYIKSDVRGMLSFYESTQLRTRGESVLDEAFEFTETQLKSVIDTLEGNLARQVKHALRIPFHKWIQMVEARSYFSNYEEECSTYDSLPKLAIAHFNYLQLLQKNELYVLTKWYKDMQLKINYPFVRDKVPEMYLWILAMYFEPQYSQARIITAKIGQLVSLLNDIGDAYGTIDELRLLLDAFNRWEISAIEQLPEYMKPFYKVVFDTYTELEDQLSKEGKANLFVNASKQAFQEVARGYHQEAEWRHIRYMPSFEEYVKNGVTTSSYDVFAISAAIGMGTFTNEDVVVDWYTSHPKILEATKLIGRLQNDVVSVKFENERGYTITGVDAYMKTFGVTESIAKQELMKIIKESWKDINEGYLIKPTEIPLEVVVTIINLARITNAAYTYNDEYTFADGIFKESITLLLIDDIPM